jgi:uncharacterized iron-regulated membrane protein
MSPLASTVANVGSFLIDLAVFAVLCLIVYLAILRLLPWIERRRARLRNYQREQVEKARMERLAGASPEEIKSYFDERKKELR